MVRRMTNAFEREMEELMRERERVEKQFQKRIASCFDRHYPQLTDAQIAQAIRGCHEWEIRVIQAFYRSTSFGAAAKECNVAAAVVRQCVKRVLSKVGDGTAIHKALTMALAHRNIRLPLVESPGR